MFFWFIVFTYYTPYQEIAVLMLQTIKIGIQLFVVGFFSPLLILFY